MSKLLSYVESEPEPEFRSYPCIGIHKDSFSPLTLLFTSQSTGTVLVSGNSPWSLGYVSDCWVMIQFRKLKKGEKVVFEVLD